MTTLEWLAAALSLLGAPLVASALARRRAWGFLSWLCSNALWITWAILGAHWAFLLTQIFFSATSFYGWRINRRQIPTTQPPQDGID